MVMLCKTQGKLLGRGNIWRGKLNLWKDGMEIIPDEENRSINNIEKDYYKFDYSGFLNWGTQMLKEIKE
jgi:hypothetical protein